MAIITLGGKTVHTKGELPETGSKAPSFVLTRMDLTDLSSEEFAGKKVILNIFPSLETGVCSASLRRFNQLAAGLENTVVLCISKDLPFSFKRFCAAEGIDGVICGSEYKDTSFSDRYGVIMTDGAFSGLMSRAIVVIGADGSVVYTEQVPEIGQEPDYDRALAAL
jgi:thioredoxin-dependent peroxiredoxin